MPPAARGLEMTPDADSPAYTQSKANQRRCFEKCLAWLPDEELKARAGKTFLGMPLDVSCNKTIHGYFGTYVSEVHLIEKPHARAGKHFDCIKSALAMWSGIIQQLKLLAASMGLTPEQEVRAPSLCLHARVLCTWSCTTLCQQAHAHKRSRTASFLRRHSSNASSPATRRRPSGCRASSGR